MKHRNQTLSLLLFTLLTAVSHFAFGQTAGRSGGSGTGGADTYLPQLRESYLIAAQLMANTNTLKGVPEIIKTTYKEHRSAWISRLKSNPSTIPSETRLFVDKVEKAATADSSKGIIELNKPYWDEHPLTMVQSVVLAVHETGHLINIPLKHKELDEIGFVLIRQNQSQSGRSGKQQGQFAKLCVKGQAPKETTSEESYGRAGRRGDTSVRHENAQDLMSRGFERSEVPTVAKLTSQLRLAMHKGWLSQAPTWATKAVMDSSKEISQAYSSFYLSQFEALQVVLSQKVDSRPAAEILAAAKELRAALNSEISPLNLQDIHTALMSLKQTLEKELPPHQPAEYKKFLDLFLEQLIALRYPSLRLVEDELLEFKPFFGATSTKDLDEKLLPALNRIADHIYLLEKESGGKEPPILPFKQFRRYYQQLNARGSISMTEKTAALFRESIDGAPLEVNKLLWEMKGLENQLKHKDLQPFFNVKIQSAGKKALLASKQLWIPYFLKHLDEMVIRFSSQADFGMGFINVNDTIRMIGDLQMPLKPRTQELLSYLSSHEPAEDLRAASRGVASQIRELREEIGNPGDLNKSLHRNLDSLVSWLYSEKTIPREGYDILRKLNDLTKEYNAFIEFVGIIVQDSAEANSDKNSESRSASPIWCQEYSDSN